MFIFLKWYYAHLNLRNERRWAEMTEEERAEHGIKPLPTTLHNAIKAFKKDDLIKSSLGDHLMHSFIESKELEWSKYSQSVSDWERQRYMNW